MKKIVGTIAAIALAATSAFADVGIGAWGRGIWSVVAGDSKDINTFSVPSWAWGTDYAGPRVGISIHGDSENVGFNIDMNGDNGGINAGDTQYIWVKPWSFLEVQVGKVQDNQARGDACFGAFNWLRNSTMASIGEDFTFTRFGNGAASQAKGAIVKVTPIEGLWVEAAFDIATEQKLARNVYGHGQYGAGYRIDGIGHIRAQFIGKRYGKVSVLGYNIGEVAENDGVVKSGKIEAAFDLTAVENLFVTVGAKIPVADKLENVDDPLLTKDINAYASYGFGPAKVHAMFGIGLNPNYTIINAGVGVDYDFGNGISATADFRFGSTAAAKDLEKGLKAMNMDTSYNAVSFLVGVQKGFSNGYIGLGFQGTTDTSKVDDDGNRIFHAADADKNAFAWQVPIAVQYAF